MFSSLTGCSQCPAGERYSRTVVYHVSDLVRPKKNGLRALGESDQEGWIVRGDPEHSFGNQGEF